ncbi:MAG: prolipoprotein diacylglyceryl transferase [Bacteroidota bacterium]
MLDLLYITWDVSPEIFSIGSFAMRWYQFLFAGGFFVGYFIVRYIFRQENLNQDWLESLLLYLVLGTVIGARLGHVLFYNPSYYLQNPLEIFMTWKGGLASHGGTVGVLLALWLWSRRVSKKPFLWITDRLIVAVALASCFIRLGNLMNSEILGVETTVAWAFEFVQVDGADAPPRHPAQLYEALGYLGTFFFLGYLFFKTQLRQKRGFLTGLFLILVFGSRFLIEFVKIEQADFQASFLDTLTLGQWLSIPFVLLGAYFMYLGSSQEPELPLSTPEKTTPPAKRAPAKSRKTSPNRRK